MYRFAMQVLVGMMIDCCPESRAERAKENWGLQPRKSGFSGFSWIMFHGKQRPKIRGGRREIGKERLSG